MAVFWEKNGPVAVGFLGFLLFLLYAPQVFTYSADNSWKIETLYSSIFDLSSIIVAFIFGFFTFARTSETEFLHQIRKTTTYRRFMRYLLTALYSTAAVVLLSLPFMVAEPKPTEYGDIWMYLCAGWVFIVAFALSATVRSIRQFVVLAMIEREND